MAIAVDKHCPFVSIDHLVDPNGRFVFKGTILEGKNHLCSCVNPKYPTAYFSGFCLKRLLFLLGRPADFEGRDFNVSLDPQLDTSSGHSTHSFSFKHFRKSLHTYHLVGCWRVFHPTDKDLSYYSATHAVYTRIDLLLMDQFSLESFSSVSIGSLTILDQAPVSISLYPSFPDERSWTWPLNENLLDDVVALQWVLDSISLSFTENSMSDVGLAIS